MQMVSPLAPGGDSLVIKSMHQTRKGPLDLKVGDNRGYLKQGWFSTWDGCNERATAKQSSRIPFQKCLYFSS
jgi:NADPH:quinone reductase-like Zn-dependent oxidoreductase